MNKFFRHLFSVSSFPRRRESSGWSGRWIPVCAGMTLILLFTINACSKKEKPEDVLYYTCPMHSQIQTDAPGQCPICGMDLVAVSPLPGPLPQGEREHADLAIDPRWTQAIGVKTHVVKIQNLSQSLWVQGKVAHDPKLWVTQKEYLLALKLGDPLLIRSAEKKLYFLGLSKPWIKTLKRTRNADLGFHLPVEGKPTFLEAFLNQSDRQRVEVGQSVAVYDLQSRLLSGGTVRSLGILVELDSRTVRAIIQADQFLDLSPNSFVQIKIDSDLGSHLATPKSAVLFNGDHTLVYVQQAPGQFVAKKIELGMEAGEFYAVKSGLKEGDAVVVNGQFLIDSETKRRSGAKSRRGHQH